MTGVPRSFPPLTRRVFLGRSAAAGISLLALGPLASILAACGESTEPDKHITIDLATDTGVLNFLYAVLQLEADFYERVVRYDSPGYPGMPLTESATLSGYGSAVTASAREMINTRIPAGRITDFILFKLGTVVNFSDRTTVLTHARTIEDAAARGFAAASAYVDAAETATFVSSLATAAADRANGIRALLGTSPLTVMPQSPAEVMTTLAPYYLTTITVTHA